MVNKNTKRGGRRGTAKRSAARRNELQNKSFQADKDIIGFPLKMVAKLRYCDTYQIASTSGSTAKQVLILNSTFDPDSTGTGHQPLYRDVYASIYDQYAVISARVKVTFLSNASTSSMLVGCTLEDDTTSSSTVNVLCEQATAQHHMLPNNAGSLSSHTFIYNWSCKKMLGIDPFVSQTYKTAVGSNPTETSALVLWAAPADGAATTTTTVFVELDQTVLWTELSTPTSS